MFRPLTRRITAVGFVVLVVLIILVGQIGRPVMFIMTVPVFNDTSSLDMTGYYREVAALSRNYGYAGQGCYRGGLGGERVSCETLGR
jgi:hypothetical protein